MTATAATLPAGSSPGGLKEELAAFKRRRIREEAARLFFEQGYEGATIDAIAERLQVTKPFIYSYYRNKGEILYDVSRLGICLSLEVLERCLAVPGSCWERLKLLVDSVTRLVLDNEQHIVVYLREEKNLDDADARQIRELRSLFDHRVAELLEEGVARGEFCIGNPGLTAVTLGGMVSWVALWYVPGGRWSESEVIADLLANVSRMVRPGGDGAAPPPQAVPAAGGATEASGTDKHKGDRR